MQNNMSYGSSEFGLQVKRRLKLERQSEIRIKVQRSLSLKLRLLDGKAEIFGFELPLQVWLTFPPLRNFSVFTWYGATIEFDGVTYTEYTSNETPMISYLNAHNSLQIQRHCASTSDSISSSQGPRVIIVGSTDSGRTILAKMLLSWAAREGRKPTFVDLNVGQSSITIPGTIAATPIEMPVDPVEGFPLDKALLVHYFGHTTPTANRGQYKAQVEHLARELEEEFARNVEYRYSGMVIDTMGWIDGVGYELLVHAIRKFNASIVIVLGHEAELINNLKSSLKFKKNLQILNLDKSNGVFIRDTNFRKTLRNNKIQKYFCGATNDLTTYTKTAKFGDVQVYQIGDILETSSRSTQQRVNNPLKITPVKIGEHLVNKVLAISYAKQPDQIITSIVGGFVCIKEVDNVEESITYISPSANELPSKMLIMGTLTWCIS